MRNKNFDADLLKTLNEQPMPAAPLTDDEFARVLDAACAKLPQAKKTVKRRFPWGRVAAAAAACMAVGLGSVNFAAPAVAEQLPVVGSLFSWLNRGGQEDYTFAAQRAAEQIRRDGGGHRRERRQPLHPDTGAGV